MTTKLTIYDLISHARRCQRPSPSSKLKTQLKSYAASFEAADAVAPGGDLNLFAFHVDVPTSERIISYVDVEHDHGNFDYQRLVSHFLWAGLTFNPSARLLFVTNEKGVAPHPCRNAGVVRISTNPAAPVFERVKAMAAYVHSRAFTNDTVFLDTDAFPNRSLAAVFRSEFDIGVTYRTTPGYMPLNEGVIFCSRANPGAARRFFDAYLGTYEELIKSEIVQDYYGNIERWRGGQLSLNALACPEGDITKTEAFNAWGARIKLFPCNTHNYWVTKNLPAGARYWDRKHVLHLKGDSKRLVEGLVEYQVTRARMRSRRKCACVAAERSVRTLCDLSGVRR